MAGLFQILYTVISPIFLIAAVGWVLDRRMEIDPRPLSRLLIYVFSPCLVLDGLANSEMDGDEALGVAAVALLASVAVALVGWGISRAWGFDRRLESAFMLSVVLI